MSLTKQATNTRALRKYGQFLISVREEEEEGSRFLGRMRQLQEAHMRVMEQRRQEAVQQLADQTCQEDRLRFVGQQRQPLPGLHSLLPAQQRAQAPGAPVQRLCRDQHLRGARRAAQPRRRGEKRRQGHPGKPAGPCRRARRR